MKTAMKTVTKAAMKAVMKAVFGRNLRAKAQPVAFGRDQHRALAICPAMTLTVVPGLLVLLVLADPAAAQMSAGEIDKVDTAFQAAANAIGGDLKDIARNLLFGLLLIEMVWSLGQIVMTGGDFGRLMSEVFQRVVIAGLFLLLIDGIPAPGGTIGIAKFIIISAEALSDSTIESSIKPSEVFGDIYRAGAQLYDNTSGFRASLGAALVWLALVFLGASIAGTMLVAYIEIYMAFTIGILTLGFGAWKQTSGIARNFLFSAAGRIFKLFAVLLIVAVIRLQLEALEGLAGFEEGMVLIGLLVIFNMILGTVPAEIERIVAGAAGASAADKVTQAATDGAKQGAGKAAGAAGKAAASGAKTATKAGVREAGDKLANTIRNIKKGGT